MKRFKTGGFTFVELMIAASIFAIIAVAIYAVFGTGISAWKRAQEAQNLYQDIRMALERLAGDLENAVLYSEQDAIADFVGEENRISFYTLDEIFQKPPAHPELRKITYSLEDSTLQRLKQTIPESMQEAQAQDSEDIAGRIGKLNFSYCYEGIDQTYIWDSPWEFTNPAQAIPQGIKIELELSTKEKFTKYVFIPQGYKGKRP